MEKNKIEDKNAMFIVSIFIILFLISINAKLYNMYYQASHINTTCDYNITQVELVKYNESWCDYNNYNTSDNIILDRIMEKYNCSEVFFRGYNGVWECFDKDIKYKIKFE